MLCDGSAKESDAVHEEKTLGGCEAGNEAVLGKREWDCPLFHPMILGCPGTVAYCSGMSFGLPGFAPLDIGVLLGKGSW